MLYHSTPHGGALVSQEGFSRLLAGTASVGLVMLFCLSD